MQNAELDQPNVDHDDGVGAQIKNQVNVVGTPTSSHEKNFLTPANNGCLSPVFLF